MEKKEWEKIRHLHYHGGGAIYGLGLVGAAAYFLQQAVTIQEVILGLLKSLIWPATLVYRLLEFLKI